MSSIRIPKAEDKIPISEVQEMLGVSRRTVQRFVETGRIPEPLRYVEGGRGLWVRGDIQRFIDSRLKASAAETAVDARGAAIAQGIARRQGRG